MTTRSAILFLVFNRPDTTRRVFEAIRTVRPARLYVAADGARPERSGESQLCDAARAIATDIDWPCEVQTLFRDENLGCKRAVSSAIDWFFEHEPEGVILEDDCLPDRTFFACADQLLEQHRDNARVMCISGVNFISSLCRPAESYYFSRWVHIWGWASWRRAWNHYDVTMESWRNGDSASLLQQRSPRHPKARRYLHNQFNNICTGKLDTWDYQWVYACLHQDGLNCMPASNLITNIGFDAQATHTINPEDTFANRPRKALDFPLSHPTQVAPQNLVDRWGGSSCTQCPRTPQYPRALDRGSQPHSLENE